MYLDIGEKQAAQTRGFSGPIAFDDKLSESGEASHQLM